MTATLLHHTYGKSAVRLTTVHRHDDGRHDLAELSVDIELEGDFGRSYTHGDNSRIVATDTMKNTVYALARQHVIVDVEAFAQTVARHFLDSTDAVTAATVSIRQAGWARLSDESGAPHPHAFVSTGAERRTAQVRADRDGTVTVHGGLDDLVVLKTARSGFTGFQRDRYTSLKETTDRIMATSVTAVWRYTAVPADPTAAHDAIRRAMLTAFAGHDSLAVQQTLLVMAQATLDACAEVAEITMTLPNQHRLLVDLSPFSLDNPNAVFVATSEPYGMITATVGRNAE